MWMNSETNAMKAPVVSLSAIWARGLYCLAQLSSHAIYAQVRHGKNAAVDINARYYVCKQLVLDAVDDTFGTTVRV